MVKKISRLSLTLQINGKDSKITTELYCPVEKARLRHYPVFGKDCYVCMGVEEHFVEVKIINAKVIFEQMSIGRVEGKFPYLRLRVIDKDAI